MDRWRKLSKKEKSERLEIFSKWKENIDERIDQWKQTLAQEISNKLDKSPESLTLLEKHLNAEYPDANSFDDLSNAKAFDAIATYLGEVYRLHLPGDLDWKPGDEILEMDRPKFYFYFQIGFNFKDDGIINPALQIPYVLHSKPGNELYEYFSNSLTRKFSDLLKFEAEQKNQIPIPGRGGYSYQYFILLQDGSLNLNDLEKKLKQYYNKRPNPPKVYLANDVRLVVEFTKDFCFHFWYDDQSSVLLESKEIAQEYKNDKKDKAAIAACKHRIEFWGDSDSAGNYFNEHLFILSEIVKIPDVFVYNFKQGFFYDEV